MPTTVESREFTLETIADAPAEVARLIQADSQPKKVRIHVLDDESLEAFCRYGNAWFPVTEEYWHRNTTTNGFHLSGRSKPQHDMVYRPALRQAAADGTRKVTKRGSRASSPTTEIVEVGDRSYVRVVPAPERPRRQTRAELETQITELETRLAEIRAARQA